jgi:1,4-dihydroxy-2-naphthoate octaprenyltransferase
MIALMALAIYAPTAYSLPPLKLGYRPFAELTVVVPALVGVVVGTSLVLSGSVPPVALGAGFVHALFCVSWFIVSRIPDYNPDRKAGKNTTVVRFGRQTAVGIAGLYACAAGIAAAVMTPVTPVFAFGIVAAAVHIQTLAGLDPFDPEDASEARLRNMHTTTAHSLLLAAGLALSGVA